jgi:hypothetical protein
MYKKASRISIFRITSLGKIVIRTEAAYDVVSKSFRAGRLERELQMVQLFDTKCNCIAILWVSLVSFAAITFVLLFDECLLL